MLAKEPDNRVWGGLFAALVAVAVVFPLTANAQILVYDSGGGVSGPVLDGTTVSTSVTNGAEVPAYFFLLTSSGQNVPYTLSNTISGTFDYTMQEVDQDAGSLFSYGSSSGDITLTSSASINVQNIWGGETGSIGTAAIQVLGQPFTYDGAPEVGGDILVNNTGNITVAGNGARANTSSTLIPAGFRTADLSGINAISWGLQNSSAGTSRPGGSVDVNVTGATISMSQATGPGTDSTIITAGISASSANGPGSEDFDVGAPKHVSVDLNGSHINNTADTGFGVLATATGATLANSSSSVAFGNDVGVLLENGSTINLTDEANGDGIVNSIGVYASSVVYMPSDPQRSKESQAGNVLVTLNGANTSITTGSADSVFAAGVLAISAGGESFVDPFSQNVVNGNGASAHSGTVGIINEGAVTTAGTLAIGLAGLSVGGGASVTTSTTTPGESYLGINNADTHGDGGVVNITNTGLLTTLGKSAYGIVALSTGAGGVLNNAFVPSGDVNTPSGLVVGNNSTSGGSATKGGAITVLNSGIVTTGDGLGHGDAAIGIIAQSIGGGGGNAGGDQPAVFVGDKGGSGGSGGALNLTIDPFGSVTTYDVNSLGILAESIGGGGGNGANAKGIFVAVGGRGGSGGTGGDITVDINGALTTLGEHSAALVAHSIGGGGGNGGAATSLGEFVSVGIGGAAGGGGSGGTVTAGVGSNGTVRTVGNNSGGLLLQSVGGGGGTGGAAMSGDIAIAVSINYAMGGSGGVGGSGGTVTGTNNGSIVTGIPDPEISSSLPNMGGADSPGMMAQSIGGGGGHGGGATGKDLTLQSPISGIVPATISFNMTVGGAGGSGSDGGAASLTNAGTVTTWGDGSYGLLSQSVGGGGGDAGDSTAASLMVALSGPKGDFTVAVGGTGGQGGSGGVASASNNVSSEIHTYGQNAPAIVTQSIGGGGGTAGIGNAGRKTDPVKAAEGESEDPLNPATAITIGVGGSGGSGGHSAYTTVTNNGTISTFGSGSQGIVAQAIGGGGGLAGGGNSSGDNYKLTINLGVGGTGGDGGDATTSANNGNSVSVTNSGTITTKGGDGTGILAQSIGGGGGAGGSSDATASVGIVGTVVNFFSIVKGYNPKLTIGVAAGGDGGTGGAGGNVLVDQTGTLSTAGSRAYGILAQSISGGGGIGGSATAGSNPGLVDGYDLTIQYNTSVAVGGDGGDGHNGGKVVVNNGGSVTTTGYGSHAVVAQSVSGGGGIGADGSTDIASTLGLGIGAQGTTGGSSASVGGPVQVTQTGTILTQNGDASGIVAQSIGGGGGIATTGNNPTQLHQEFNVGVLPVHVSANFGINSHSTGSNDGGSVTVTPSSTITTQGDWSHGIVAQSVGGGGGKGGTIFGTNSNAIADLDVQLGAQTGKGNGGTVTLALTGSSISTGLAESGGTGYGAHGIIAQAIGGGGGFYSDGSSVSSGTINLGGGNPADVSGSRGGTGGTVNLNGTGSVTTVGTSAYGVILQSIGGGGGVVGAGSSVAPTAPEGNGPDIRVGGANSDGKGNDVTSTANVTITTYGANAFGIVAQSIGGGGGIATSEQTGGSAILGATDASLSFDHYNGGNVNLTIPAPSVVETPVITTNGAGAHGIVAQSIGGGGGIVNPDSSGGLDATRNATNAAGKALGYGGDVNVTLDGGILTNGAGASGIVAQSIGGGGGLFGSYAGSTGGSNASGISEESGGTTGNVTVVTTAGASVVTTGAGSTGIFAQNVTAGNHGLGKVDVTVGDSVSGGTGVNDYGIWVDGGNSSNLVTIQSGGSVSSGSLVPNAIKYTGSSQLNVLNQGSIEGNVALNSSSTLTNEGLIYNPTSIVGNVVNKSTISQESNTALAITGNLTQSSAGTVSLEVTAASVFSTINVSGTADWSGSLVVTFDGYIPESGQTFQLFTSGGTGTYNFSSSQVLGLYPSAQWEFVQTGNNYALQIVAVPEPSAYAAGMAALLSVIVLVRRRRMARER